MVLYRKYRPKTLDELYGNRALKETLSSLLTKPPHTFLLMGPSGTGKTTLARIIANNLGCDESEYREFNMSDTRGIDFARGLIQEARMYPLRGKVKVYVMDECQNVTGDAQNSMLKILEEPPKHVYFILCTTAPEKILETIKTRCYKYTVSALTNTDLKRLLNFVIEKEKIETTEDILELIVEMSEGVPRTALVLLDMLKGITDLNIAIDIAYKEIYNSETIITLCRVLLDSKSRWVDIMKIINSLTDEPEKIRIAIYGYITGCLKRSKTAKDIQRYLWPLDALSKPLYSSTAKNELIYILANIHCNIAMGIL